MTLWTLWIDLIGALLNGLASEAGFGLGLAIIAVTVLLRGALLPLAWPMAYRACIRQKKLKKLQPQLQRIRERHANDPAASMQEVTALYRRNDLTLIDVKSLLGTIAQMPVLLGLFHALRTVGEGTRFLWIANLMKPDLWLAIIAGMTTALMMTVNPDMPEQMRAVMIVLPSILIVVVALKFSSALAIYWATSNCFSALQTVVLHRVVEHRIGSKKLEI